MIVGAIENIRIFIILFCYIIVSLK